jgi:hypothetical protein
MSGPSVSEAREALTYWSARHSRLAWHRFAARAEARTMERRWRTRLVRAHLDRWRLGFLEDLVAPLFAPPAIRIARRARRWLLVVAAMLTITVLAVWTLIVVAVIHLL